MRKIITEPLFHFLLIGSVLFLIYGFLNRNEVNPEDYTIRIEEGDINLLTKAYLKNWNTLPDSPTLERLIDAEIQSEIFYREAMRLNLDHNDEIIRRRLKQKYEFLVKDLAVASQPPDDTLLHFYNENISSYLQPKMITFSQIYFSPDKREHPKKDAVEFLKKVNPSEPDKIKNYGDEFHLQSYYQRKDLADVRQLFGMNFARQLFASDTIGWQPPIESGYGFHLVNIEEIETEKAHPFKLVRDRVYEDWKVKKQQEYNDRLYENLLKKYEIIR